MIDIENITKNPGCYLFKDKKNKVIYVGKAKNLKKRVNNYFHKNDLDIKTQSMLKHAESLDFVVTDTEVEALILENTLIKKYQPHYNIRLKDAKSHSYILLTDEDFPRVVISRNKLGKGRFYGPFVSAAERDYILQFLRRTFMLRTCKNLRKNPCLRFHIKLCEAPCAGKISKKEYNDKILNVKMVLSGKNDQVIKKMKKQMRKFSEKENFEKALQIRNQIGAIEHLNEKQKMEREKKYNEDIINYQVKDNIVYLMLFNIYRGTLSNKKEFVFDYNPDFLEEFIIQYYSENVVPEEIIIPEKISEVIQDFLTGKKGSKVRVNVPKKGEKKQLLDLVDKNIEIVFFADVEKIKILKSKLSLNDDPVVIECFDISHLSGTSTVGSMVQFRNGKPDKNNYRRFKIRTVDSIDDTAAIAEVVRRRYRRLKKKDAEFPNLIVIDGGRGQLNYAIAELNKLGLRIPIVSVAKKFEEIFVPGRSMPIVLSKKDKALRFIQEIRDEAHRFAIKYNRLLRKKEIRK